MRRAFTIGAPSIVVNKNRLGQFPEFRDQGVGGSNPLSPTNLFNDISLIGCVACETRGSLDQPIVFRQVGAKGLQLHHSEADYLSRVNSPYLGIVISALPVNEQIAITSYRATYRWRWKQPLAARKRTASRSARTRTTDLVPPKDRICPTFVCAAWSINPHLRFPWADCPK